MDCDRNWLIISLAAIGYVSNAFNITIFRSKSGKMSTDNTLLMWMAVCDHVACLSLLAIEIFSRHDIALDEILNTVCGYVFVFAYTLSLWLLVSLVIIYHPATRCDYKSRLRRRNAAIIGCFFVLFIVCAQSFVADMLRYSNGAYFNACPYYRYWISALNKINLAIRCAPSFLLLFLTVVFTAIVISRRHCCSSSTAELKRNEQQLNVTAEEAKTSFLLMTLSICVAMTELLYARWWIISSFEFSFLREIAQSIEFQEKLVFLYSILRPGQMCSKFFIYYASSSEFRDAFKNLFFFGLYKNSCSEPNGNRQFLIEQF